jgi:AbrB family looped-hinge helix DNA binding protein
MGQLATVSSKGQVVIPATLRKKYGLKAGSRVSINDEDGRFTVIPNPFDALLALRGCLSHIEEDVEGWWMEEKRKEREREDAKLEASL